MLMNAFFFQTGGSRTRLAVLSPIGFRYEPFMDRYPCAIMTWIFWEREDVFLLRSSRMEGNSNTKRETKTREKG